MNLTSKQLLKMLRHEGKLYGCSDQYARLHRLWNEALDREREEGWK